jgi:hypothetical protein
MAIRIHPHARDRMEERGATEIEVRLTVESGERFPAKFGRMGFRRNFAFGAVWRERFYQTKQVEVIVVEEAGDWLVIIVMCRFF